MAESYIPAEAYVICSNMTCGVPRKLLPSRSDKTVAHSNGSKILLTVEDRKIDESFECVKKGLDWGGFEALAAGICIGALVVATVATGGLALAATGVMFAAAGATVISGVGGIISIAHACDYTLKSLWEKGSLSVKFNKHAALLNRSSMFCLGGNGTINIILDKQIAMDAAKAISDSNMNAFYWKMGSQFVMGAITAITAASSSVSLVAAAVLAVPSYFSWKIPEKYSPTIRNIGAGAITYIAGMVVTKEVKSTVSLIGTGAKTAAGYIQYGYGVLVENIGTQFEGAIRTAIHSKQINPSQLKGFAAGLGGAAVNVGIGIVADNNIDDYKKEASDKNNIANEADNSNSINVVSIRG